MRNHFPYKLYLVISKENCVHHDWLYVARQAIIGGVDIIQLREKNIPEDEFLSRAMELKMITDEMDVPLIINDKLNIAMEVNAYGIHVGNNDMAPSEIRKLWPTCKHIGYSFEYIGQLTNQEIQHADALGVSPVFKTGTKTDTVTEWGLEGLSQIRSATNLPLIAIGNINIMNAEQVLNAGADCLAVVSAICGAEDPFIEASSLRNIINKRS